MRAQIVSADRSLSLIITEIAYAVQQVALGERRFGGSLSDAGGAAGLVDMIADHRVSEAAQAGQ